MSKSTHYPLTHDEFLRLNAELKDAELRVYLYLMTLNPFPNSVMEIDTAQISERLGITRRTVQRAVKQLQELQLIEIEITKFKYKKAVHGASSRLGSDDTRIVSSDIRIANGDTQIATTPLKPLPNNDSSSPQINKINKTYLDSLSEDERENFLEFGKKKAAELPKPPTLTLIWIEKNFEDIRSQWLQTRDENKNQNQKYNFAAYSQAQHQMWYGQLQVLVCGAIQSGDRARLEQFLKDDFYSSWLNWAKTAREDVREFLASNPIPTENKRKSRVN